MTKGKVKDVMRFSRFAGIIPPDKIMATRVNLIGCGGIGSWAAMALICMGVDLRLFDYDKTEEHNYGGQPLPHKGKYKVEQIEAMMGKMARELVVVPRRFDAELAAKYPADIWISGVDSIDARKEIWKILLTEEKAGRGPKWYIDGRMGGTTSHRITVELADEKAREKYERSLEPAGGFTTDPCAMRSTVFAGMGVASRIVATVGHILIDKAVSGQVNDDWMFAQSIEGWTA